MSEAMAAWGFWREIDRGRRRRDNKENDTKRNPDNIPSVYQTDEEALRFRNADLPDLALDRLAQERGRAQIQYYNATTTEGMHYWSSRLAAIKIEMSRREQ